MTTAAISIDVMPAARGDCLWIECARENGPPWRLLIDGGMPGASSALRARIKEAGAVQFDLAVVSHIDSDHIGGMLPLFDDPELDVSFGDVWFNGLEQLPETAVSPSRSVSEGMRLVSALSGNTGRTDVPWNQRFERKAVMTRGDGEFEAVEFPDGPTLTLLSPTPRRLAALRKHWEQAFSRLQRGEPEPTEGGGEFSLHDLDALANESTPLDRSVPNGSSIAFLLEHRGRSCLFAADAFSSVLGPALTSLALARGVETIELDVFKLSHHGSHSNTTKALLGLVRAEHYVISTNGDRFNHPDDIALARVVTSATRTPTLWFNYASKAAQRWSDPALCETYKFRTERPKDAATPGVRIELPTRST